ncbi:homogentisate 1,2-dioxygenase [Coprinopsis cinerea okayama7|uniref:homogentisate 1,2-dioxygenase n=1 Tax=Coprinopsis cinerea (strain Okayama-7 / 130 / ATCC MYA-4618 / FGSC 9003) TaxID=240176 RepID=A8NV30_COPC7|nr:homogentisate 1,2-dioxygenase [Coprinopsis cinerea okayama7\|eukprot:XP_001836587.2 homogentisate 1,2-dioxygenase [Coprinopsis cinerea okayama7\
MGSAASGATAKGAYATEATKEDPYIYQPGFGNRFASEALPGVLPVGQNSPQRVKYDLYAEGLTGASFVAPRAENLSAYVSNILHLCLSLIIFEDGYTAFDHLSHTEASRDCLITQIPTQLAWRPFDLPPDSEKVDFVQGLKTVAGNGDPTLHEGLAIHMYLANTSMGKKAFCNNDGDILILPQQGRLDIQTEFGRTWGVLNLPMMALRRMMVRSGELCVIQRGMKFKVVLPDGPSRGYIQEIYGQHYVLPELGPLGGYGLANARDFEHPVASFDIDQSPWEIIYKVGGQLHLCNQDHTPFDVVAWTGNYVPYKYALEKFINVGSISKDHIDPSIFCVLTAKSKQPNVPLCDFLIFSPRWDVATDTFRPPYYHRNSSTEFMGLIYGVYEGRSDGFQPGGASYETGFCPHGVSYEEWKKATEDELKPVRVAEGTMAFMFETSMMLTISDWALKRTGKLHEHEPGMWDGLKGRFTEHIDEINKDLKAKGLPPLGVSK